MDITKFKLEYFDKPNVELFGKTISSSLDFRQEVDKQSSFYLNDMFAIGILDWFASLYPHATINNENDIKVQAFPIARFIYENSSIASQSYYIIRQYFEWMNKVNSDEDDVILAMEGYIVDHCLEIYDIYQSFKEKVGE